MTSTYPLMLAAVVGRSPTEQRVRAMRTAHMLEQADGCVRLLSRGFAIREAWLFGSVAYGRPHAHSDLDLAVLGLAPGRYFEALGALDEVTTCEIDLVPLEEASESLRAAIARDGRRLL